MQVLFERYHFIETLILGGGEPLLHPEIISYIVDSIIENDVFIAQLQIVTNGTIVSPVVAEALNRYSEYIAGKMIKDVGIKQPPEGIVLLSISDLFHDNDDTKDEVYGFYKDNLNQYCTTKMFDTGEDTIENSGFVYSGRAKTQHDLHFYKKPTCKHRIAVNEMATIMCKITLTPDGNFVFSDSTTFEDEDNYILCPVDGDIIAAVVQWNKEHPLTCEEEGNREDCMCVLNRIIYEKPEDVSYKEYKEWIKHYDELEEERKKIHAYFTSLTPDDVKWLTDMDKPPRIKDWLAHERNIERLESVRKGTFTLAGYCTCPKLVKNTEDSVPGE